MDQPHIQQSILIVNITLTRLFDKNNFSKSLSTYFRAISCPEENNTIFKNF